MGKTIAGIVGLGVVLGAAYLFWRSSIPACPSLAQISARVQQHPSVQQCANIAVAVEGCVVRLQGRIENATQRTRLREAIQSIPGIAQVNDASVQSVDRPFCEVLDILDPLYKREETLASGLAVKLVNKSGEKIPVYSQGEHLILEITTPLKFESYVYVDYYTVDGQVQHLFPNPLEATNFFPPRSVYVVGQLDEQHIPWKALPPFGKELLTVITSKHPLVFTPKAPRYDPEPASLYIDQLQRALPRGHVPPEVAVASYLIETREKP
ncbi:MAG: DUF4384 domain-containing protein [Candidatus Tectimicrobiota bacterium]